MNTRGLSCEPYRPEMLGEWLSLMEAVQAESDAWEAVYDNHPAFDAACDFCFFLDGRMVGAAGGWRQDKGFSVEIIAVHPEHRLRGVARRMLELAKEKLSGATELSFWTRDKEAAAFYEKLGFARRGSFRSVRSPWKDGALGRERLLSLRPDPEGDMVEYVMPSASAK